MSKWQKHITTIYFGVLAFALLTSAFIIKVNSWSIFILLIIWLFVNSPESKFKNLKLNWHLILPFVLYFLAQVYGFVISTNTNEASFMLEKKLAFLAIPTIVFTGPIITSKRLDKMFDWLSYKIALGSIAMLFIAAYKTLETSDYNHFYYHNLSNSLHSDIHAVYFSLMVAFGLLYNSSKQIQNNNQKHIIIKNLLIALFAIMLLLLASKTVLFVTLILYTIWLLKQLKGKFTFKRGMITLTGIVFFTLIFVNTNAFKRYQKTFGTKLSILNVKSFKYNSEFNGLSLRLILWQECLALLEEQNAFIKGVGIGDLQDKLAKRYKSRGMYAGNSSLNDVGYLSYNPHNQFLQEWASTGLFGLLSLLFMLVIIFKQNGSRKHYIIGWFILFSAFMITESSLQRHHGFAPFLLIASLSMASALRIKQQYTN